MGASSASPRGPQTQGAHKIFFLCFFFLVGIFFFFPLYAKPKNKNPCKYFGKKKGDIIKKGHRHYKT
ncbi:unnamed protein product [Arabidopsis halleri]